MEYENSSVFDTKALKREFIAGGIAGGIGIFIGFPLDLIKVNLQVYPNIYKSTLDCFQKMVRQNGFKSLYRGCVPPIFTQGFINSMLFCGEATTMRFLQPELKRGEVGTPFNTILAGMVGGVVQSVVLVPSDVVKCTMQAEETAATAAGIKLEQQNALKQTISCATNIYRTEGIRGLFKGYFVTIAREMPSIGLYFFAYKNTRDKVMRWQGDSTPSTFATLLGGGVAGAVSWTVIYPCDVVKTFMQISTKPIRKSFNHSFTEYRLICALSLDPDTLAYKDMSIVQVSRRLLARHGVSVFFGGLGATVARAFPVNAAVFFFYERISDLLNL